MLAFISKKLRAKKIVKDVYKHAKHLLHYNDDVYSAEQKAVLAQVVADAKYFTPKNLTDAQEFYSENEKKISRILPKNRWSIIREYIDIIAVAFMVAFGVRGLILQPFKIPTGSMQPTLFGIHYVKDGSYPNLGKWGNFAIYGAQQANLTTTKGGRFDAKSVSQDGSYTSFNIGSVRYSLPGTPQKVGSYTGLLKGRNSLNEAVFNGSYIPKGTVLSKGNLVIGDHLFVDRFTFNFTGIKRGDIIVFNTVGLSVNGKDLSKDGYYYIKRLVGMPEDELKIINNVLHVKQKGETKFRPITELSEKFAKIYSKKGGYHGHTQQYNALYLTSNQDTFKIPKDSYFMMGDNSLNSQDSRYFGVVPRRNIVGRALFVFWPFTHRWGFTDSAQPIDVKSKPNGRKLPAMSLQ